MGLFEQTQSHLPAAEAAGYNNIVPTGLIRNISDVSLDSSFFCEILFYKVRFEYKSAQK